jgi:hypothetical protein
MHWKVVLTNKVQKEPHNYSVFQLMTKGVGIVITFSCRNHILCKILLKPMITQIKMECFVLKRWNYNSSKYKQIRL